MNQAKEKTMVVRGIGRQDELISKNAKQFKTPLVGKYHSMTAAIDSIKDPQSFLALKKFYNIK